MERHNIPQMISSFVDDICHFNNTNDNNMNNTSLPSPTSSNSNFNSNNNNDVNEEQINVETNSERRKELCYLSSESTETLIDNENSDNDDIIMDPISMTSNGNTLTLIEELYILAMDEDNGDLYSFNTGMSFILRILILAELSFMGRIRATTKNNLNINNINNTIINNTNDTNLNSNLNSLPSPLSPRSSETSIKTTFSRDSSYPEIILNSNQQQQQEQEQRNNDNNSSSNFINQALSNNDLFDNVTRLQRNINIENNRIINNNFMNNRLERDELYIEVISLEKTGSEILDETLKILNSDINTTYNWILLLTGDTWNPLNLKYQIKRVKNRIRESLLEKEVLSCLKYNFLLINYTTYPIKDTVIRSTLFDRMIDTIYLELKYPRKILLVLSLLASTYLDDIIESIPVIQFGENLRDRLESLVLKLKKNKKHLILPPNSELIYEIINILLEYR